MSRVRAILLSMSLVIVVLLAQTVSQAQGPGGPGGGRGGRGGPGGFGGRNRISSPLRLATNVYVQEDLKLTSAQKADIKALSDKIDEQRKEADEQRKAAMERRKAEADAGNNPAARPENRGRGGRTRGETAPGAGKADAAKGETGTRGGPAGGRGGPGFGGNGGNFAAGRAAMERQQAETEAALAKILTKPQRERILQIQLQQEGPMAVTKPSMQKKLNMSETQIAQIAAVLDERDQARGEMFNATREMFSAFRTADGGFDRNAMQAKMQDPQFKAQMDKAREEATKRGGDLEKQTIAMIGKTMSKKQHQNFQKMQGPPFDLAKLERDYDPAAAALKAEAAEEEANAKKAAASSSKKKTTSRARRSN